MSESYVIARLPSLFAPSPSCRSKKLPELCPFFFVPPLEERPQNPIVEALVEVPLSDFVGHDKGDIEVESEVVQQLEQVEEPEENIWSNTRLITERQVLKNQTLSWDALRPNFPKQLTSTPFLSEQSNNVFDAVRHYVQPRLNDPSLQLLYILPAELLDHLMINMVGNSSPLYTWNPGNERLCSAGTDDAKLLVIIEGFDGVTSTSIIRRFLTIGTLMRRLETLVIALQRKNSCPTVHAFSHALSTVLDQVHNTLTSQPPHPATYLLSLWMHYAEAETILSVLSHLCYREEHQSTPYEALPDSPTGILSHIYKFLEKHIDLGSPRTITGILAYILTIASRDYFTSLEESLGMFQPSRAPWFCSRAPPKHKDPLGVDDVLSLDDVELDQSNFSVASDDQDQSELPIFIPLELAEALPAARKSLRILRVADPDHYLYSKPVVESCEWVWSSEEVERLWEYREKDGNPRSGKDHTLDEDVCSDKPSTLSRDYRPELEQFRLFDLEPGAHLARTTGSSYARNNCDPFLLAFLASFPHRLPSLTPTIQHLATVVLQPLITRTAVLSSSLLELFLTSLQLETHLVLLRSFMLLTFPSFKTRIIKALFSDTDEQWPVGRGMRARARARLGMQDARDIEDDATSQSTGHGIGLGPSLAERDTWPPGGADLSFFLRSVVVDSLGERTDESKDESTESVWKEAGVRLGFALRDLPIGDGRERWLNPMSIEALDFFYLHYKPPHPLDVVITPDILSKYQRIFTFLVRLLRVEAVVRIAYRGTFKSTGPVFSYAPEAQETLVYLRFQIQAFVTAMVTYVFDCAIGGNFDSYMRRISKLRDMVGTNDLAENSEDEITDVFSLQESHSHLLDRILSGCLLRTVQRAAGDVLKDLLGLILQYGALIASLRRGIIREADGAEELFDLNKLFQRQMLVFINIVQAMHAKEQGNDKSNVPYNTAYPHRQESGPRQSGQQLGNLLTRIDPTGWWRRKIEKKTKDIM